MKVKARSVLLVAVAVLLCGLVAACGSGGSSGGGSSSSSAKGGAKRWKLAIVTPTPDPFWLSIQNGAKAQAAKMGVDLATYSGPSGATDASGAIAKINDALTTSPDGMVMVPNFVDQYVPVIRKVLAAGVKVALAGGIPPQLVGASGIVTTATTNEAKGGALAGAYLKAKLPPGSQVGVLHCAIGNPTMDTRVDNMEQALGTAVKVVSTIDAKCDPEKGRAALQDMLTAFPKLAAIFSNSDNNIFGSLDLIKNHKLVTVSYDAQAIVARAIKQGVVAADVVQFPEQMGALAVKGLVDALNGKRVPPDQDSGVELATKQNIAGVNNN